MLRKTALLPPILAGVLLLPFCCERFTSAQEKGGAKKSAKDYGFVKVMEHKTTYPPEKLGAPPEGFDKRNVVEVIPYDLIGGPITFHGKLYVMDDDNDTFTDGTVSPGPNGGCFAGQYRLTKTYPIRYIYDSSLLLKRHRLEIMIDYDCRLVAYREQWRSLGVWYAGPWHILVTW